MIHIFHCVHGKFTLTPKIFLETLQGSSFFNLFYLPTDPINTVFFFPLNLLFLYTFLQKSLCSETQSVLIHPYFYSLPINFYLKFQLEIYFASYYRKHTEVKHYKLGKLINVHVFLYYLNFPGSGILDFLD